MRNNQISSEYAAKKISGLTHWYHRIEITADVETPGVHDSKQELAILDNLGLPLDCDGLRVLDIGCRDGFFSFEMERRGAEVVAIDYAAPEAIGFSIVAPLINSNLECSVVNVYDLNPEEYGQFDIVLFLGVLYHLRNPLLGLDKIRNITKPGGLLFVETQLTTDPALKNTKIPICQFFPGDSLYGDGTNTWGPNEACLHAMIEESQFDVCASVTHGNRGYAFAKSIENSRLESFRKMDSSTWAFSPKQKNNW